LRNITTPSPQRNPDFNADYFYLCLLPIGFFCLWPFMKQAIRAIEANNRIQSAERRNPHVITADLVYENQFPVVEVIGRGDQPQSNSIPQGVLVVSNHSDNNHQSR